MSKPIVINYRNCKLAVYNKALKQFDVLRILDAFELEDLLWGIVPRITGKCEEIALAFENFIKEFGYKDTTVKVLKD